GPQGRAGVLHDARASGRLRARVDAPTCGQCGAVGAAASCAGGWHRRDRAGRVHAARDVRPVEGAMRRATCDPRPETPMPMSRAAFLRCLVGATSAMAVSRRSSAVATQTGEGRMLTRAIPATGESLPVVGV